MPPKGGYYFPAFFYVQIIPELLRGRSQLHVLLASKAGVGDLPTGDVETSRDGLTVSIQSDSLAYPRGELKLEAAHGKGILAVAFADLDDLDEALALLQDIRDDHPTARVTLITDEYALFRAPDKLRAALEMAAVDGLVITGLAGRIPMRKTLEHILQEWGR